MQRLNCLGEVIERLFMPEVEIDCETALRMLACSVPAKGREKAPLLVSDLAPGFVLSEGEFSGDLQFACAALVVVG
jgi:hypothetical protein